MTRATITLLVATVRLVWSWPFPWINRRRAYDKFDAALDHLLWLRWVAEHPEDA